MALFDTEFLSLSCADIQVEKQWWIRIFDCKEVAVPADWDDSLPSDIALKLPGDEDPTILLSDKREVQEAGYERSNDHPLIFCTNLKKVQEYLRTRGVAPAQIQGDVTPFFELSDPEGSIIEICKES